MKYSLSPLAALLATPALAHPADLAHAHGAELSLPLGLTLIALAGLGLRRVAVRARR